jgi:hypothetical protein
MANPDTRETNVDSLVIAIPVAILFLSLTTYFINLIQLKD